MGRSATLAVWAVLAGWTVESDAGAAAGGTVLVANNDVAQPAPPTPAQPNTVTFLSIDTNGTVTHKSVVNTGADGIGGGFFAYSRIAVSAQGSNICVFASNAASGSITGISNATLKVTGNFSGSKTDDGSANGIGLATNQQFLYAGYSTSSTIATFAIHPDCTLSFVSDVLSVGLQGGLLTGMAVGTSMLVTTYGDGSIASYNVSGGAPVSNDDLQNSSGAAKDQAPGGVVLTSDGHFAIFGDASTVTSIEVADISSGKLTGTTSYEEGASWNSGNVRLSPDETLIFITNNSGGGITAAHFNKQTGKVTKGCSSGSLRGFYNSFSYAGAAALQSSTGTGGLIYVPEFGSNGFSSLGVVQYSAAAGEACTLTELATSPIVDDDDASQLMSIETYPAAP